MKRYLLLLMAVLSFSMANAQMEKHFYLETTFHDNVDFNGRVDFNGPVYGIELQENDPILSGYLNANASKGVFSLGINALSNVSLFRNTAFGAEVMTNNTGERSIGVGFEALHNNTGDNVYGFGNSVLYNNTGNYVNGIGYSVLYNNTGNYVNGIGNSVLYNNTGNYVNGIGYNILRYNEGNFNNVFGKDSFSEFYTDESRTFNVTSVVGNKAYVPNHNLGTLGESGFLMKGFITVNYTVISQDTLQLSYVDPTPFTLTPQYVYEYVNIIGNNIDPTRSHQSIMSGYSLVLPESTITEISDVGAKAVLTKEAGDAYYIQKLQSYTFATLPASPIIGTQAIVTDANAPTWNTTIAGGGTTICVVYYDGTNWIAH